MPTYCYTTEDGTITREKQFRMGEAPAIIRFEDGVVGHRDLRAEWTGRGRKHVGDIWPIYSTSMGVLPSQIKEAYAESVRRGVPTLFDEQGRRELRNSKHRYDWCKANGVIDCDGGYGDYTG